MIADCRFGGMLDTSVTKSDLAAKRPDNIAVGIAHGTGGLLSRRALSGRHKGHLEKNTVPSMTRGVCGIDGRCYFVGDIQ